MPLEWRHIVRDADSFVALLSRLGDMPHPFTVKVSPGEAKGRSISQNGLFHAWMGQIAKAMNDSIDNVKADCHIRWGIPIFKAEDAEYADFITRALGGRARAEVKEMIERGYIPCTRIMPKPTMARYMDAVWLHYSPHVKLWNPDDLKWREHA